MQDLYGTNPTQETCATSMILVRRSCRLFIPVQNIKQQQLLCVILRSRVLLRLAINITRILYVLMQDTLLYGSHAATRAPVDQTDPTAQESIFSEIFRS